MEQQELNRRIIELVNNETGLQESALSLLLKGEEFCFGLRTLVEKGIQSGSPVYGCGHCGQPVKITAPRFTKEHHSFHFKHLYKSGDCPIKTDSNYTRDEVQCMKYNGAKESPAHMELKCYLANKLRSDDRFTNVEVEKVVKASGWSRQWKKPDVSARFNGRPVVFEIQLSTTFLDVIVKREIFYQNEGMSIFWVFNNLNPATSSATEKDVFFNNKANALSINDESRKRSLDVGELLFDGHYKKPVLDDNNNIEEEWGVVPIGFSDFQFDPITHKPFFILFDEEYDKALLIQRAQRVRGPLSRFEELVLNDSQREDERCECVELLRSVDLCDGDLEWGFLKLVKALLSVRDGVVYFPNQDGKWAWLVNYIWEHHKAYWLVLLYVVNAYGRTDTVFKPTNAKLQAKRQEFRKGFERHGSEYDQDSSHYPLLNALFPALGNKLKCVK